jgi:hypothetical protein
MSISRE